MANKKSRFPSYGLVRGPSHEHGGVAGVVAGEQPVELEGGEWIIPKEVVPDYLPVLKQITNEGRAIQKMDTGNTAMDALIASASLQTGLAQPKSPMYQEGGKVSFEQIADLAKLYGAKQGITLNPADYTPEGGRSKEGYARKFGLPEDFTVDTLAYSSPTNYSLQFLDAGGEKLGTSKSTGIYPILQDIRAAQINSRLDDKVSLENMSEYMAKQREDSKFRDMFRTLIGSAERNYPKEKQREQGGPVYQEGGAVSKMIAEMFPASQHGVQSALYDMTFGSDDIQPTNVIDYARDLNLTEKDLQRLTDTPASQALKSILAGREFGIPRVSEGISKKSPLTNLYKAQPKMAKTAAGRERLKKMYLDDLQIVLGMNPYGRESEELEDYMKSYAGNKVGQFSTEDRIQLLRDLVGASQRRLPSPTLMEDPRGVTPMDEVLAPLMQQQKQGGMIDKYQAGGQALPRKQQEMRNPTVYGPPIELMGPMPADTSAVDTTDDEFQHLLNQLRMRDVNQNINPFTGDTIDTYLDSLRLQERMKKSKIPQSAGRKKARQGGPVMYQEGGMVQGGQTLDRRPPDNMGEVTDMAPYDMSTPEFEAMMAYGGQPQANDSLMAAASQDRRVKPIDIYSFRGKGMDSEKMEIPKLSVAYLASFGMATPLSRRQGALLQRKMIAPETLNPQVKGLINRVLVQRLTNEVD